MPNFLVLDEHSRLILRLWLSGRERLHNISPDRWDELKSASSAEISHNELAEIIDCYGPKILDLLMMPLETKKGNTSIRRIGVYKMKDTRTITINTLFFPPMRKPRLNCGFISIWRPHRHKLYSFATKSSLNRLAKVLCVNTTVTHKPDNIEVAGAYFKHDCHVTEIIVTGKL